MICLLLVGKISKGRETNEHLVSFFLKESGRRREWCWRRKLLARKKKSCHWFWQISSQNYRIVFSCWSQCLFSVTFFFWRRSQCSPVQVCQLLYSAARPLASVVSRALGLMLTSQLAICTWAEQGPLSAKAGGRCELVFPAYRDGSDADSAVTSVYVAHEYVERAHPAWKRVQVSLKNHPYSSLYLQRLEKSQNKLSVSLLFSIKY